MVAEERRPEKKDINRVFSTKKILGPKIFRLEYFFRINLIIKNLKFWLDGQNVDARIIYSLLVIIG